MSVDTQNSRDDFAISGGVGETFDTTFPFVYTTDLRVTEGPDDGSGHPATETLLTEGVDYSVSGGAWESGTITTLVSLTAGHVLRVQRLMPYTQPTSLQRQGELNPTVLMRMADRLTMLLQQLVDGVTPSSLHGNQDGGSEHTLASEVKAGFMSSAHFVQLSQLPQGGFQTTTDLDIYVDPGGDDDNDGLSTGNPVLTWNRALEIVPFFVKHAVTVHVAAGTYVEQVKGVRVIEKGGSIAFRGSQATFTPATGIAGGTVASQSLRTVTVTGAGWTVNDLRDKFLKVTSTGVHYPVVSNTATTVELASHTDLTGQAFTFVAPEVVLDAGGTTVDDIAFFVDGIGYELSDSTVRESPSNVCLIDVELRGGMGQRTHQCSRGEGLVIKYHHSGYYVSNGSKPTLLHAILLEQAANGGYGVYVHGGAQPYVDDVYGRAFSASSNRGVYLRDVHEAYMNDGVVMDGYTWGLVMNNAVGQVFGGGWAFRNGTIGIYTSGSCVVEIDDLECTGNTSYGIYQEYDNSNPTGTVQFGVGVANISNNGVCGVVLRSYGRLAIETSGNLSGNVQDAIRITGPHCYVSLRGATTIAGNGGYGLKMDGIAACLASIEVQDSVAMSGNVAGDFTLDNGATAISVAALRAITTPVAKLSVEPNFLNRLHGVA